MTGSELIVIHNKRSGKANISSLFLKQSAEKFGYIVKLIAVEDPQNLAECVEKAADRHPSIIAIAGGDGSVRTAAEVLLGRDIPLLILPLGTANVLAKNLHLPTESIEDCLRLGISGKPQKMYVGEANEHVFMIGATIGVSNHVFKKLSSKRKAAMGNWAYLAQGIVEFSKHKAFKTRILTEGGGSIEFSSHQLTILNGSFAVHDFFKVYPPHNVFIKSLKIHTHAETPNKIHHLSNALREMQSKADGKFVKTWEVKKATIETDQPQQVALDAELVTQTPLRVSISKRSIRVLTPS